VAAAAAAVSNPDHRSNVRVPRPAKLRLPSSLPRPSLPPFTLSEEGEVPPDAPPVTETTCGYEYEHRLMAAAAAAQQYQQQQQQQPYPQHRIIPNSDLNAAGFARESKERGS
ncbi:unnamed protein product, partial [Ectocarpus sp. 8 AP-2014]